MSFRLIRELRNWAKALFGGKRMADEVFAELEQHIEFMMDDLMAKGMSCEEARKAALRKFGNATVHEELSRDAWGTRIVFDFWRDIRFGFRQLSRQKLYAMVAIATLAISIGAGTSVFSLVNGVLLQSLPVPDPQNVKVLHWTGEEASMASLECDFHERAGSTLVSDSVAYPIFDAVRQSANGFADVFGFAPLEEPVVEVEGLAHASNGMMVSENFFAALRARPLLGRFFDENDAVASANEIVLSYDLWSRHFGRRADIVGEGVKISGVLFEIVGVLPAAFSGIEIGAKQDFYICISPGSSFLYRPLSVEWHWFTRMMARTNGDVSDEALASRLTVAFEEYAKERMANPQILIKEGKGGLGYAQAGYRRTLWLMLGLVLVTLLIACANLAGLSLARGVARHHEFATRAALGANVWRLLRQSVGESVTLGALGGGLGLLLSIWGTGAVADLLGFSQDGLSFDFSLNGEVLAFCLGATLLTVFLAGMLPALRASRVNPYEGLKQRSEAAAPRLQIGKVLVVGQICLSLCLLAGAAFYVAQLRSLRSVDLGFNENNVLLFKLNPGSMGHDGKRIGAYYAETLRELESIQGVQGATLTTFALLGGESSSGGFRLPTGFEGLEEMGRTWRLTVSNRFFDTMEIGIRSGRGFSDWDTADSQKVIVVNQAFADKYFPDSSPIGFRINCWSRQWEVIGVCSNAKFSDVKDEIGPTTYFPIQQRFYGRYENTHMQSAVFAVRGEMPAQHLISVVRETVSRVDSSVPPYEFRLQEDIRDWNLRTESLLATTSTALGIVALLLCCIGLYGLMAYNTARRSGEMAVRIAIGGSPASVAKVVIREGVSLGLVGIGVGVPLALMISLFLAQGSEASNYGDPVIIAWLVLLFLLVALVAAWLPARRVARLDPLVFLRGE